jgi:predicted ATPase
VRARLFGRETAIAGLRRMLLDAPGIVTVTGPGGVGKTALVDHAAAGWDEWSPWAVEPVRVDLSDLSRADMVLAAIAHVLGIAESTESPLALLVPAALSDDANLVVLDNFEHVVGAAAEIAELAQRCPHLRLRRSVRPARSSSS